MKPHHIYIILLSGLVWLSSQATLAGQSLATDSAFQAELRAGRITDSTLLDRIKALYTEAIRLDNRYQFTGRPDDMTRSLELLNTSLRMQDSLRVPYPLHYAAAAYRLGQFYLKTSNFQAAYVLISAACHYAPANTSYLEMLAMLNENSEDTKLNLRAIDNFHELVKRRPGNSYYHLHLFSLMSKLKRETEARAALTSYETLEGESIFTLNYRIALCRRMKRDADIPGEINSFIARNPKERAEAEIILSNHYLNRNRNDSAFMLLNRNLDRIGSYDLDKLLNPYIATILEAEDTARVLHMLDTLVRVNPDYAPAHIYTAHVQAKLLDTAAVIRAYRRAIAIDPALEEPYHELFMIYVNRNLTDSITAIAREGHTLFHTDEWAYYHIIAAAQRLYLTDSPRAADSLRTVCRTVLNDSTTGVYTRSVAYMTLGDLYNELDSLPLSFQYYDSCLTLAPGNGPVLNNYAYRLATMPQPTDSILARAEKMAARSLNIDPANQATLDTYAWILYLRGDPHSARLYIDKLIRIAKEKETDLSVEEHYHIYRIYLALGLDKEAQEHLEAGRRLYRADPEKVKLKEIIDALK